MRLFIVFVPLLFALNAVVHPCTSLADTIAIEVGNCVNLRVIDGDTIECGRHVRTGRGEPLRLANFDAPEHGDRAQCEAERQRAVTATGRTRDLLQAGNFQITFLRTEAGEVRRGGRGRPLVLVTLHDGRDLGEVMITEGLARPLWNNGWSPANGFFCPEERGDEEPRGVWGWYVWTAIAIGLLLLVDWQIRQADPSQKLIRWFLVCVAFAFAIIMSW